MGKTQKKTLFPQGVTQSMGACENVFFIGPFLDLKKTRIFAKTGSGKT